MFHSTRSEAVSTFAQRHPSATPWVLLHAAIAWLRTGLARRQQRRELLEYLTSDHRAAADLGLKNYNYCNIL